MPVPIAPELFRDVMSYFASGVTIATAEDEDGTQAGLTVTAFCPVSAEPPSVLVCVDKASNTLPIIGRRRAFTVNMLASAREGLANRFASKDPGKFDNVMTAPALLEGAGPLLPSDSIAALACRVRRCIDAGDHWIFIATAEKGVVFDDRPPLVYNRRTFAEIRTPALSAIKDGGTSAEQ
jgi:flavin reductase (DIM6/NTAB) family NADH-FMN oxidoreductase RutF